MPTHVSRIRVRDIPWERQRTLEMAASDPNPRATARAQTTKNSISYSKNSRGPPVETLNPDCTYQTLCCVASLAMWLFAVAAAALVQGQRFDSPATRRTTSSKLARDPGRQVRWMVNAGRAATGVESWATNVASLGAITGLVGCCGRFHVSANGTFFDEWSEQTHPLSNWDFAHNLGLTVHFVLTVDQQALLLDQTWRAIPEAVRVAVASNFTGYALDYEAAPSGEWGSATFTKEVDGASGSVEGRDQ